MGDELVYVVDDDHSIRTALERLLRSAGYRTTAYGSAEELLAGVEDVPPRCLVLDVRMPGMGGLEAHEALARRGLTLPVVFLTGHGDVPTGVQAIKRGAIDFLLKPVDDEQLLASVAAALAGHADLWTLAAERRRAAELHARLSPREREVMSLVVAGRLNKQIAGRLGISQKTVKVHRAHAMEKMQAASVAELVRLSALLGLQDGA